MQCTAAMETIAESSPRKSSLAWLSYCASSRAQRVRHVGKGSVMLRIYPVVLEVLKQLQPALQRIEGKDRDLARQRRRASSSVALNAGDVQSRVLRGQLRAWPRVH